MPVFDSSKLLSRALAGSHYGFSGTRIEDLGSAEYTLVTIVTDVSGSVTSFRPDMEKCIQHIVSACCFSPRADNLLLRLVTFDDTVNELHGFKPLKECHPNDYSGCLATGGLTALFDASTNAVRAMTAYGRDLTQHGFGVNGIVFVITDGGDNKSTATMQSVKEALGEGVTTESLESLVSVLVGVNIADPNLSRLLMDFSASAAFSRYVELENASASTLAGLAEFASRSIAAQSVALGSGLASSLLF